jgi:hypothetical protein
MTDQIVVGNIPLTVLIMGFAMYIYSAWLCIVGIVRSDWCYPWGWSILYILTVSSFISTCAQRQEFQANITKGLFTLCLIGIPIGYIVMASTGGCPSYMMYYFSTCPPLLGSLSCAACCARCREPPGAVFIFRRVRIREQNAHVSSAPRHISISISSRSSDFITGSTEEIEPEPCLICLEDTDKHPFVWPTCNHKFHPECARKWWQYGTVCPTCRHGIHGGCANELQNN